jgi:threonine/homoserine/homoserine lactone efflux protein
MLASTVDTLLRGGTVGLLSSVTVGPAAVLCIKRTLSRGRRAGFLSGLGVAFADTLLAVFAFFFYSLLKLQIEQYSYLLSILGGIFVLIIGVVIFLQKSKPKLHNDKPKASSSWRDFFSMFGFTLANFVAVIPYILLFFALLGVSEHDGASDANSVTTSCCIIGGFFLGATLWWFVLTLFIGLFRRNFRPHHMQMMNRIAGVIIGLLGIFTILLTVIKNAPNGTN